MQVIQQRRAPPEHCRQHYPRSQEQPTPPRWRTHHRPAFLSDCAWTAPTPRSTCASITAHSYLSGLATFPLTGKSRMPRPDMSGSTAGPPFPVLPREWASRRRIGAACLGAPGRVDGIDRHRLQWQQLMTKPWIETSSAKCWPHICQTSKPLHQPPRTDPDCSRPSRIDCSTSWSKHALPTIRCLTSEAITWSESRNESSTNLISVSLEGERINHQWNTLFLSCSEASSIPGW